MPLNILLLENCVDMEYLVRLLLEEEGLIVSTSSFTSILKDSLLLEPDLIILSPRLRQFTEINQLCKNLRAQHPKFILPIMFLSARLDLEKFAEKCNANAYVSKPFGNIDFLNTVKDVLSI
jgi:DNA-binding response OmpR family regulator